MTFILQENLNAALDYLRLKGIEQVDCLQLNVSADRAGQRPLFQTE
jgi:cobalt-precorrin-6B (C15)-methyltransferase